MISYALDKNNNLVLDDSDSLMLVKEGAEVVQAVRCALKFFLGEASWDISKGVPYIERIFGAHPDLDDIENIIKSEILSVDGVARVVNFDIVVNRSTRLAIVTWEAETTYGEIVGDTINDVRIN